MFLPSFVANKILYQSYLRKNVSISRPIYAKDNFFKKCPKADYYVTGSDQVWNSIHNEGIDKHYFFDSFPKECVKIAYASSFGRIDLPKDEEHVVRQLLSTYKAISVRENSARTILKKMGYESTQLVDPTIMLDQDKWKQYIRRRLIKEKYLYVYLPYNISNKELIYRSVRKIAILKKLKVVTNNGYDFRKDKFADKTIIYANPGDFLSLMYYSEYVMTNSFHGTAFSINLNKQFWVYKPSGFSTRIESILELTGLQDRLLSEQITETQIDTQIDYSSVNRVLDDERKKGYEFLHKALGGI